MRINPSFLFCAALSALIILLLSSHPAAAQCAMCKATVEANPTNAGKYGAGLNTGILYLMSVPYVAAGILGYLWYRNARIKNERKAGRVSFP
jgi:hypothetical protein